MNTHITVKAKHIGVKTYCIKELLKLNGFKYSRKAKAWYQDIKKKASVEQLLKSVNLDSSFEVVEISEDSLSADLHVNNVLRNTISMKEVQAMGVASKDIQKLIAKSKIRISLFELDKLGRKVNKQLNAYDVKREFKHLSI
jgi:hypothetical protein